jgi:diadenosine tetraphosphate (Ap4A) HIT family hydrolase
MMRSSIALLALTMGLSADTPCPCDPSDAESMKLRQCSLCVEAEKHPPEPPVFFVKDINPRKPNRWLALPRRHAPGLHSLADLPAETRTALWSAAIERAKSSWGVDWAVAYNGDRVRTQCHTHLHVGKLLPGVEAGEFVVVNRAAEIPAPVNGEALWVHPVDGKLHVHRGEQIAETVLLR